MMSIARMRLGYHLLKNKRFFFIVQLSCHLKIVSSVVNFIVVMLLLMSVTYVMELYACMTWNLMNNMTQPMTPVVAIAKDVEI